MIVVVTSGGCIIAAEFVFAILFVLESGRRGAQ